MMEDDYTDSKDLDTRYPTKGALDYSRVRSWVSREDALCTQYRLESLCQKRIDLYLTNNRKRLVSVRKTSDRILIRMHHIFIDAPDEVLVSIPTLPQRSTHDEGRITLRRFIHDNLHLISKSAQSEAAEQEYLTKGKKYDLALILKEAIAEWQQLCKNNPVAKRLISNHATLDPSFLEERHPFITWTRSGNPKRKVRFGSYTAIDHVIRINPALDQSWIPDYFLKYVVYHEYLHSVFPPEQRSFRRIVHTRDFNTAESLYPHYEQALHWERNNLSRFLR